VGIEDKIFYNESSSLKLGWTPEWFGCNKFNEKLLIAIEKFQEEHGLGVDGLCGPSTYRRIFNHRVANLEDHAPMNHKNNSESFIIYNYV
jgi:murein L,D-transpeptidase YcbB/YkuD